MSIISKSQQGSKFFHVHAHSDFSVLDGMSSVRSMVSKAAWMKQPAIALTDHGQMAGTIQLYRAGQEFNLPVFPGFEGYIVTQPIRADDKDNGKLNRYHVGFLALNFEGYQTLVKLLSLAHTRPRFNRFPRLDLNDLAAISGNKNIAVTTGCFFGMVQQTLVNVDEAAAKRVVQMYARWFPNTFVELQNHNIDHEGTKWDDSEICNALTDIAHECGLPTVITQDSHYLNQNDKVAHDLMKKMVYRGEEGANEFPGDSFHLATGEWVRSHHDKQHWYEAIQGLDHLLSLHDLSLPALDKYQSRIPSTKKNPQSWLRRKCELRLRRRASNGGLAKPLLQYEKRLNHELDIIEYLGQAGYFGVWDEFVEYCHNHDKYCNCGQGNICIEARGSGNGSLVNWLLGITQIDPLQWGLLFERFLSKDRKKPPDIDMDIEDDRRDEAVAWLEQRFGVVKIGTFGALGARDEDDKGSILVSYNSYLRAKMGNDKFIPKFGRGIERIGDVKNVNADDYEGLRVLSKLSVKRNYGVHAAGLLLPGDDMKIEDYVPTMLVASSDTVVSQFTMDDVEELGLTKKDLLGQRTLTVMKRCQELIGRQDPTDFSWIPLDDKLTCKMLSNSQPESGIFQFEGWAMAKGARTMKIRNTFDCVLAGALFRPACMESGMTDLYIERRFDREKRIAGESEHPHPAFAEVLKSTNGIVLFQEQILEIMRRLGLDYEGINTFFKIIKDSGKGATDRNIERLRGVRKQWSELCKKNGITDVEGAWQYLEGYTKYGFNKAHSTGYGVRSYRVAYLKAHYPLEFMAALLECNAGKPKEASYIKEARRIEIRLLSPDVNISGADWTIDRKRGAIRKGLSSIKGIGKAAAVEIAANAPYENMDEFLELNSNRTVSGKPLYLKSGDFTGNLEKLRNAGALTSLGIERY